MPVPRQGGALERTSAHHEDGNPDVAGAPTRCTESVAHDNPSNEDRIRPTSASGHGAAPGQRDAHLSPAPAADGEDGVNALVERLQPYVGQKVDISSTVNGQSNYGGSGVLEEVVEEAGAVWVFVDWGYGWVVTEDGLRIEPQP